MNKDWLIITIVTIYQDYGIQLTEKEVNIIVDILIQTQLMPDKLISVIELHAKEMLVSVISEQLTQNEKK